MTIGFGKVYLVGAGPGDPELITVRGRELLGRAQVVVYDGLVNEALLQWAPGAEAVYVGKRPDCHTLPQEDINRILLELAAKHACVVRLKGGDPFVFGRGGEEAEFLRSNAVSFEIVPGITAGLAAPMFAGIPVTHRTTSRSVTLISGHGFGAQGGEHPRLDALHLEGTLAFYMASKGVEGIAGELVRVGRSADTPAAAIQWGATGKQRVVTGKLKTIAALCTDAGLVSPLMLIVGEVVDFRETLQWFEQRLLFGRRIVVTRTRNRAQELVAQLHEAGADVFELPTVEILPLRVESVFDDDALFDWIILTSVNSVDALFQHLADHGKDARSLSGTKLCAVGHRTALTLEERYIRVDAGVEKSDPESILAEIQRVGGAIEGKHFLLPRVDVMRAGLPTAIRAGGAKVTELEAYRAQIPKESQALSKDLEAFNPDYVLFNSASAARNFAALLSEEALKRVCASAVFAAIGPVAQRAAEELGIEVPIVPTVHRLPNLVEAVIAWDQARKGL